MDQIAKSGGPPQAMVDEFDRIAALHRGRCISFANPWASQKGGVMEFPLTPQRHLFVQGDRPFWQARQIVDNVISPFDVSFLDCHFAAFAHPIPSDPHRFVSFQYLGRGGFDWQRRSLGTSVRIDGLAVDSVTRVAWIISGRHVHRAALDDTSRVLSAGPLPGPVLGAVWGGRFIIAGTTHGELRLIDSTMRGSTIGTIGQHGNGFTVVCPYGNVLLCGMNRTTAIRMISDGGTEIRAFVGHVEPASHIQGITDQLFVSAAPDKSLKLWDSRQCCPVTHIGTNHNSVVAVSATRDVVVFATADCSICAVDIRAAPTPTFAITSQHRPESLCYDGDKDILSLFGVGAIDEIDDIALFSDSDSTSRKYIFQRYQKFIRPY
jgi:WD40 repeat protein